MSDAPGRVAAIVGDASNEEGYLLQRLLREALGSPHVDSRQSRGPSREALVRLAQPALSARVPDIDGADVILVAGTEPMHSAPILDLRVRKAIRRNGARLVVATERPTTLDGGAEAIARYGPGQATHFLGKLAAAVGGAENVATPLAETLRGAEKVVVLWGGRIGREGDGAVGALLDLATALKIAETEGSGLLEIPDVANARGLREVGCLPDAGPGLTKAASARPERANAALVGKGTEEIRAGLQDEELKALVLFGADPLRDFPDTKAWEAAIGGADFVIAFSMFENEVTAKADVVFPLETHAEKDGTVTHMDGRLQRVRPSAARPGDIRANWQVLTELSEALGHETGITSQPTALAAIADAVPFYAGITVDEIGGRGIRWQDRQAAVNASQPDPEIGFTAELFFDERPQGEFALGTYRDLWAGPITELNPPLKFLQPTQRVEMSPTDAERLALKSGEVVRVSQNGSAVEVAVQIKERVPEGVVFLAEGVAEGNANALLNGSPVSVAIAKVSAPGAGS